MMKRSPPAVATWLLAHFASGYQRDALIGDLIEQYHQGASRFWYWKQAVAALVVASAKLLRPAVMMAAAGVLLWLAAESTAVTGLFSLFHEARCVDASAGLFRSVLILCIVLLAAIASVASASIAGRVRKQKRLVVKRVLVPFAAVGLSIATLTWAGTTTVRLPSSYDSAVCVEHR